MQTHEELDRKYIRELQENNEQLKRELAEMTERAEKWREMYLNASFTRAIATGK